MFSLANIYYYGNGTDVDYFKAFDYYKQSAEKGCVHSYYRLGYMFRNGMGCVKNTKESDVWFAKMISIYSSEPKMQNGFNCYRLGQMHEKGWGTKVDFEKAKGENLRVIWALALPGKKLKISAGKAISDTIINILEEGDII